jgi:hypothetical protein
MSREDHRKRDAELERLRALQAEENNKPGWERFLVIFGFILAILIPLLQANGVEVNWWASLIAYTLILAVCVWSFLWHAVPNREQKQLRVFGTLIILLVIGSLGTFAAFKQYERDHTDDLRAVRIQDVLADSQIPGSVYTFHVDIENLSEKDLKGDTACVVAKPSIPLKPFGRIEADTSKERELEKRLFEAMDDAEKSGGKTITPQDIPAQRTVHAYCTSSWIPSQEELKSLEHGEFVLYVAGRVRIPSKIEGAHVDIDFCRVGDEKHGLQNCFGHNVPHVHLPRAVS